MAKNVRIKIYESQVQRSFIILFRMLYPRYIIFSIPNNSRRNGREGARLKKEGMLAGIPDIMIPVPMGRYHGLFIEFKVGYNKPTKSQDKMIAHLRTMGYFCAVCYSLDEARTITRQYMEDKTE